MTKSTVPSRETWIVRRAIHNSKTLCKQCLHLNPEEIEELIIALGPPQHTLHPLYEGVLHQFFKNVDWRIVAKEVSLLIG